MNKLIKILLSVCMLINLSACAILGPERDGPITLSELHRDNIKLAEGSWQFLNVIDTAQTINIAKAPNCFHESNFMTRAIIGEHPSELGAIGVGILYGVGHYYITDWLDSKDTPDDDGEYSSGWHMTNIAWHTVSLVSKFITVGNNQRIGLTPFGSGC